MTTPRDVQDPTGGPLVVHRVPRTRCAVTMPGIPQGAVIEVTFRAQPRPGAAWVPVPAGTFGDPDPDQDGETVRFWVRGEAGEPPPASEAYGVAIAIRQTEEGPIIDFSEHRLVVLGGVS